MVVRGLLFETTDLSATAPTRPAVGAETGQLCVGWAVWLDYKQLNNHSHKKGSDLLSCARQERSRRGVIRKHHAQTSQKYVFMYSSHVILLHHRRRALCQNADRLCPGGSTAGGTRRESLRGTRLDRKPFVALGLRDYRNRFSGGGVS